VQISDPARNAAVNAITALLDAGAAAGYIQIRTGAKPATVAAADAGTLLATLTLSKPAFGTAATGVGTAAAVGSQRGRQRHGRTLPGQGLQQRHGHAGQHHRHGRWR
jgi:hypothetical protein